MPTRLIRLTGVVLVLVGCSTIEVRPVAKLPFPVCIAKPELGGDSYDWKLLPDKSGVSLSMADANRWTRCRDEVRKFHEDYTRLIEQLEKQ